MPSVIRLAPDEEPALLTVPTEMLRSLAWMNQQVEGYFEVVSHPDGYLLWLNEDGMYKRLRPNAAATRLIKGSGAVIPTEGVLGNVVVTGPDDGQGNATGLSVLALEVVLGRLSGI